MDSLVTYYLNRAKEYRSHLRSVLRAPNIEVIHNLRLVIKKNRALYHLAASHDPHFYFDLRFESFTEIFKAAGSLRDIDITLTCLSKTGEPEAVKISEFLRKERLIHARRLKTIAKAFLAKESIYDKEVRRSLEEIRQQRIKDYLAGIYSDIKKESKKKMNDDRLHGIRKLSKEYLYLSRAGGKELYHRNRENLRLLNPLQKSIGKWHDYVIALEIVKSLPKKKNVSDAIIKIFEKEEKKLQKESIKQIPLSTERGTLNSRRR